MATYFDTLVTYAKKFLPSLFSATGTPGILGTGDTDWTPPMAALVALNDHMKLQDGQIPIGFSGTAALTNPTTGPTVSASTGGSLATGTYDVAYSYVNTFGETLVSGSSSVSVTGPSGRAIVTAVTPPAGATVNWYVSDAPGSLVLRLHTSNSGGGFNVNAVPGGTNAEPPSTNTTASADHAEKGTPTGSNGIVVTPGSGTLDISYSPTAHNDQNGYYLKRLRIENFTTTGLPAGLTTADKGRLAWDTTVGTLKGWDGTDWVAFGGAVPATGSILGLVLITGTPADPTNPIAVGDNDSRMTNARTPVGTSLTSGKIWVGNGSNAAAAVTPSGDATVSNSGAVTLANTAVTPGSYTNADITVNSKGLITAAANGTAGGAAPVCRVKHSVNQSSTSGVYLTLAFDTEYFDTDAIHDNVTDNSRLTCKTAGKYMIYGAVAWDNNSTGYRYLKLTVNTSTVIGYMSINATTGDNTIINISTMYDLVVNDYVELSAFQNSGSNIDMVAASDAVPVFGMYRVA